MYRKPLALLLGLFVLVAASDAAGEPIRVRSPSTLTTVGGTLLELPADVVILEAPDWQALDEEVRRLQDQETRLTAENDVLRRSGPGGPIGTALAVLAALVAGIAIGFTASR